MNEWRKKIDELCDKKGITHRRLAEEIGVTEVTMSRYLSGHRTVGLMPFMAMCRVLDIPAEDLYKTYLFSRMRQRVRKYAEKEGAE